MLKKLKLKNMKDGSRSSQNWESMKRSVGPSNNSIGDVYLASEKYNFASVYSGEGGGGRKGRRAR